MIYNIYLSPSNQNKNLYAYGNTNEKVQCEAIADFLKSALLRCGFDVKLEKNLSMKDRVKSSNKWKANMHIPIHTNAYNGKIGGTRIFYYAKNGYGDKAAKCIFNYLAPITLGTSDAIKKYSTLYEVKYTKATSPYVECEFHDVKDYAKWIIENKEIIAEAICKGVCDFYSVKYVEPITKIYKVQCGAFKQLENAEKLVAQLKKDGYSAIIV